MNINEKFEKLMKDIQENIKDPKDLEYINKVVTKNMLEIMENIDERTYRIEKKLDKIENELFIDEDYDDEDQFEVSCPYCNSIFATEIDELKTEIICPECKNIIELDWADECDDDCHHGGCSCCHDEYDDCDDCGHCDDCDGEE